MCTAADSERNHPLFTLATSLDFNIYILSSDVASVDGNDINKIASYLSSFIIIPRLYVYQVYNIMDNLS